MYFRGVRDAMGATMILSVVLAAAACGGSGNGQSDGGQCQPGQAQCSYYSDCAEGEDCVDGCCQAARTCANDSTCQPEGLCVEGRCVHLCVNDTDCPADAACVFGFCSPYPQEVLAALTAAAPDEAGGQQGQLRVGIGDVALDFPVGVSMWGFGGRLGPRTPYRDTLGGSDSMFDRPRAKAFVFDNGRRRIILVRAPMGCSTDFMASEVAWQVYQATGENYLNRLVFSAPHTHSHPGRFWNIFYEGVKLGVLGAGDFSYEMFHRIATTLARAVLAALDDLQPARFGYAVNEHMDPQGVIHHYRRGEYPGIELDDTLVVMRIDDDQGRPRAVLVNMALHGTHFDGTTVSMDAPGAVELIAQQKLQELTGRPVEVAFLSRSSGDVSPAGDGSGLDDWRKVQQVGELAWPKIKELYDSLEGKTTADVELQMATRRVPVNHQVLGYGPEDYYDIIGNTPCEKDKDCSIGYQCIRGMCGTLYLFGGFQCVSGGDEDPATRFEDGHLGCIFSAQTLSKGRPIPQFTKARMSVLRIGDLGLVTVPGEPLSQYGRDLAGELAQRGFADATVLGYSQDHHLYIMHADNWLQGGYEPSMGIWGWREGDYYFEQTVELMDWQAERGTLVDDAGLKPTYFEFPCAADDDCGLDPQGNPLVCGPESFCIVAPTASVVAPAIIEDVAPEVERISLATLTWAGGHPGVDLPRMTLEREEGGGWVEVTNNAGVIYSDDGYTTITFYRGDYDSDHTWELHWEEKLDFPTGRYRIHIEGHYYDGQQVQSYQLDSRPFDFVPCSRLLVLGVQMDENDISAAVMYPPGPTNDDGQNPFSQLEPLGVLRHTGLVPPTMPWPVPADGTVTVTVSIQPPSGDAVQLGPLAVDGSGQVEYHYVSSRDAQGQESTATASLPASLFTAAHGAWRGAGQYQLTVTASDSHGNGGSSTLTLDLP